MSKFRIIELPPIIDSSEDYEQLEKKIKELWRTELYAPLMKTLGFNKHRLKNSMEDLAQALRSGRVTFYRGRFKGRFNAAVSKELKRLGASWDRKTRTFRLSQSSLPQQLRVIIAASERTFQEKVKKIDKQLEKMLPAEIADNLKASSLFGKFIFKVNKEFQKNVKNITVTPKLSKEQVAQISKSWNDNMELYIKDWTEAEIKKLRSDIQESVLSGVRYEETAKVIEKSYGQSANKAKFLARQETNLLMSKFKQTRYEDAGINEYKWKTVSGSPAHPVRPMHKRLDNKIFRWDDPPVTNEKGNRNHPGEDYNCRCFPIPVVRVKIND